MNLGTPSVVVNARSMRRAPDLDSGAGGACAWIVKEYRKLLAGSLLTLGNLSMVSLIFGQAVAREALNWRFVTLALVVFTVSHIIGYWLMKGVGDR